MGGRGPPKTGLHFLETIGKECECLTGRVDKTVLDYLSAFYWRYLGMDSADYQDFATFCTDVLGGVKNDDLLRRFDVQYGRWRLDRFNGATSACMVLLDPHSREVLVLERNGQPFIPTGQLAIHQLPSITARAALRRDTGLLLRGEPLEMLGDDNLVVYIAGVSKPSKDKFVIPEDVDD